jgi:hypothetical protein
MPKSRGINPKVARCISAVGTGRNGPFNKAQDDIIISHFDDWYDYAFVQNPNAGGRGSTGKLTKWKQERAKEIMKDPAFEVYPAGVGCLSTNSGLD